MKWDDQDPVPGVDNRDYVQEGRNNAIGLVGYLGGTVTAIPSFTEALWNVPNILRRQPYKTFPGSFNWLGQKTGLEKNPLYQIGGIGYGGASSFGMRQGLINPIRQVAEDIYVRSTRKAINRLINHPAFDPKDMSPFGDMINATLIRQFEKQDPVLRAKKVVDKIQEYSWSGAERAPVTGPTDIAITYGVGAERAHRNIENQRSRYPESGSPLRNLVPTSNYMRPPKPQFSRPRKNELSQ